MWKSSTTPVSTQEVTGAVDDCWTSHNLAHASAGEGCSSSVDRADILEDEVAVFKQGNLSQGAERRDPAGRQEGWVAAVELQGGQGETCTD